ncbi:MAG: tyrosine--tRNA ligase [Patescibacteria group bacterium]
MNLKKILSRGVTELIGEKELEKKLATAPEKVVIKYGVDPTRPDIHLGHAVCLRKLREFQDLGCRVVFLIGDFTARIGDPTGKSKIRPELDQAEVEANVKTYLDQAGKILKTNPENFSWIRNSDWFVSIHDVRAPDGTRLTIEAGGQKIQTPPLPGNHILARTNAWLASRMQKDQIRHYSLINLLAVLRRITHARLIERDMFQDRIKKNEPIFMHEMLYPVIQGIDSNVLSDIFGACDLEVGGTDQHFNMLMGREVMEMNNKKPQAVLTLPILEGTDGKEKMSKSLDNYIGITEAPKDVFGKTMRIPDEAIPRWVELTTDLDEKDFAKRLALGSDRGLKKENPKNLKIELAKELVRMYHGEAAADAAVEEFARLFSGDSKNGRPDEIPEIQIEEGSWGIVELLNSAKLVASKSEARRLIEQGGVRVNDAKIEKADQNFTVGQEELILQIGKRKWAKIVSGS